MDVTEILDFDLAEVVGTGGELDRPVMLVALEGWFDAASAATQAVNAFIADDHAVVIGQVDPDPFYDFTQQRPQVSFTDEVREITWPVNEFVLQRNEGHRDVIALLGVEPHLHWRSYISAVIEVARALRCEAIVTVGAGAEALPHTRTPPVTGSTSNPQLARALGLVAPSYEGVTGVVGVLHTDLESAAIPSVSLRVGIPHYLMNAEHPQAVAALVRHLSHVLDVPNTTDLSDQVAGWRRIHDEVVDSDDQMRMYVSLLEAEFDRRAEAEIPSADDLGAQFESFLRDQRDD